ncbi:rod-determining factor RdfA [Natribaculum luteum]|uniref:Rod-determining factor RdfA n=1 Tax=Natribaculum luteum TaxID=1586232 RepID=A0ABD5P2H7_9EURY|nr:rod-determining factor RdfA [Natribaculum luteum]
MDDSNTGNSPGRRSKVVRLIDEYELEGIGAEMERLWTTSGDDRMSLRSLADYFNQQLLAEAMAAAGMQPLTGEVENVYELLTSEDTNSADRTRAQRRLEREGVDVEKLTSDFVTYQAIRTYLKEYRDAEYATDNRDRTVIEAENVRRFRSRLATITESKLEQLENSDDLILGEFRLFVDINVLCEDCGQQYEIEELLERGGCDCPELDNE